METIPLVIPEVGKIDPVVPPSDPGGTDDTIFDVADSAPALSLNIYASSLAPRGSLQKEQLGVPHCHKFMNLP